MWLFHASHPSTTLFNIEIERNGLIILIIIIIILILEEEILKVMQIQNKA